MVGEVDMAAAVVMGEVAVATAAVEAGAVEAALEATAWATSEVA